MKKRISCVLLLLLTICLFFAGCKQTPLSMPTGKIAFDNHTSIAKIGKTLADSEDVYVYYEYLYFANAYKDNTIKEEELSDDLSIYGINRIKTTNDGELSDINDDGVGLIENITQRVAGYKNSMMFVVGDYLYFNSPNLHKNSKNNQYEFDLVCLFKIKLDGTGLKEIYKSETSTVSFYLTGGENQSLLIYDNNILKIYDFKTEKITVVASANDSTSLVFPSRFGEEIDHVYFIKAREDEITGNILYKTSLNEDAVAEIVEKENYQTTTILSYNNGVLIYSIAKNDSTTTVKSIKNGLKKVLFTYESDSSSSYSNFRYTKGNNGIDEYVLFNANSKLYVMAFNANSQLSNDIISNEEAKVRFIDKGKVIYTTSNGIYIYDLYTKLTNQISNKTEMADIFDYDGQYVYFYTKLETTTDEASASDTKYLHRASIINTQDDMKIELVAKLLDSDSIALEAE